MRPTKEEYFIRMAKLASIRGTCVRRQVGCVLVNERGHVLATGYNGVARGQPHCNESVISGGSGTPAYPHACPAAKAVSGTMLDGCEAIHAEQNALLQCHDVFAIHTCYVTHSPCVTCVKLLMGTSCRRIIFAERYAHDDQAKQLWESTGNRWLLLLPAA